MIKLIKWYIRRSKQFYTRGPEGKAFRQGYRFGMFVALLHIGMIKARNWMNPQRRQQIRDNIRARAVMAEAMTNVYLNRDLTPLERKVCDWAKKL